MKFIVLQRDDIENFVHVEQAQVHDLINEDHHNELAHILDYAKHGEQLQFIKKAVHSYPKEYDCCMSLHRKHLVSLQVKLPYH